jgi:hypothetical protein
MTWSVQKGSLTNFFMHGDEVSMEREGPHNLYVHGEGQFRCVTMRFWWRDKGTSFTHSEVCVFCFSSIFW